MGLTPWEALEWMERLLGLALVLQSLELILIRRALTGNGIWRWEDLEPELRHGLLLDYPNFIYLIWARLVVAVALMLAPTLGQAVFLLLSSILINIRFRGAFNGGSDSMTLVVLVAVCAGRAAGDEHPVALKAALAFATAQLCLSYLVAGVVKLREPDWRAGSVLSKLLSLEQYGVPPSLRSFLEKKKNIAHLACWTVIGLECAFPLALLHPVVCAGFLGLALGFHLFNAYALGLNRFLWAWISAYPALYFWSQR